MQMRHLCTLIPAEGSTDGASSGKITAICFSPNNRKLAICATDRVVRLFDEHGTCLDKFSTKPAEKGLKKYAYTVRAMGFSPDSCKLAVAQSDNIVFVYKIGLDWGEKKSICNKFLHTASITSLIWPSRLPNGSVYGLADGKVKVGQLRTNKPATLYNTESYVCAVASSLDGGGICSAHVDGTVYRFYFHQIVVTLGGWCPGNNQVTNSRVSSKEHSFLAYSEIRGVPYALTWGRTIVVGGSNGTLQFFDDKGRTEASFQAPSSSELTVAACNPTGDSVVVGSWHSFHTYTFKQRPKHWECAVNAAIGNLYAVTALAWKHDGTKVAVGSLFGSVDLYDACLRRYKYKGKFEFTYSSLSQVVVKKIATGTRIVLKSHSGFEITKINIFQDRFVVANAVDCASTAEILLLGDLLTYKLSEISWMRGGGEKFVFDNPLCCMVHHAGELTLIQYGSNEPLAVIRTDFISGHLLSLRITSDQGEQQVQKKIAYLLDSQTINVRDIVTGSTTSVAHDSKIDWLELNERSTMILFRDKRHQLVLFTLPTQASTTLLSYCTYVQWVPYSDVVVAQSRDCLCVWYNIHNPDQITLHHIRGDVEDIERTPGRTEVLVNEHLSTASYLLDEALIQFGSSLEDQAFKQAADILEGLEMSPETEGMWKRLENQTLAKTDLLVAARCSAALGNIGRARYLQKMGKLVHKYHVGNSPVIRANLLLVQNADELAARDILLAQGRSEDVITLHERLHNFGHAITIAESTSHVNADVMQREYFRYLLQSNQTVKAAVLQEASGGLQQAVELYMRGGLPGSAANVIKRHRINNPTLLIEQVATSLATVGLHERSGDLFKQIGKLQSALEAFIAGDVYGKAVELARSSFPSKVVELQGLWADHLAEHAQFEMAINHYIEASLSSRAIETAIRARLWNRAATLIDTSEPLAAKSYLLLLAKHYRDGGHCDKAEECYINAGSPEHAVDMYMISRRWEQAHRIATSFMTPSELNVLCTSHAKKLESEGKLEEAETLYLKIKEPDLAINMYKKQRNYDSMVRLVEQYRPDLLKETHQYLAQHLESEGKLHDAEQHYCEAAEWLSAVNMYRTNEMWQEAIRVASGCGGSSAAKRVAYAWALSLGGDAGAKMLLEQGLVEQAIDYATDSGAFDHAFELAHGACPRKIKDVHLKHALFLEDEERFKEAEAEFLNASKPREAIDMYIHQQSWSDALVVASRFDPTATVDIYIAQARCQEDLGKHKHAEELFLTAGKPEYALAMYRRAEMWPDALDFAKRHLPHQVTDISILSTQASSAYGLQGVGSDFRAVGKHFEQKQQWGEAVSAYLQVHPDTTDDEVDVEEAWNTALNLARRHLPSERVHAVVQDVVGRLKKLRRFEAAADICRENGELERAVGFAVDGECWVKARELALGSSSLQSRVDTAYQEKLLRESASTGLVTHSYGSSAMNDLVQRQEWARLWQVADEESLAVPIRAKYAGMHALSIIKSGHDVEAAVETLQRNGMPSFSAAPELYECLVTTTLGRNRDSENVDLSAYLRLVSKTKMLLISQETTILDLDKNTAKFEGLQMVIHYFHVYLVSRVEKLKDITLKVALTLLHYSPYIPIDKAFYLAGHEAKDQGHINLAFMLLNRYIDVSEAIEEGMIDNLDNADFAEASRIPIPQTLPKNQYITEDCDREEIRDWVLSNCIDKCIAQQLPSPEDAAGTIYATLYSSELPRCIVTGYPVKAWESFESGGFVANKADWNRYVRKTKRSPWNGSEQLPVY